MNKIWTITKLELNLNLTRTDIKNVWCIKDLQTLFLKLFSKYIFFGEGYNYIRPYWLWNPFSSLGIIQHCFCFSKQICINLSVRKKTNQFGTSSFRFHTYQGIVYFVSFIVIIFIRYIFPSLFFCIFFFWQNSKYFGFKCLQHFFQFAAGLKGLIMH